MRIVDEMIGRRLLNRCRVRDWGSLIREMEVLKFLGEYNADVYFSPIFDI